MKLPAGIIPNLKIIAEPNADPVSRTQINHPKIFENS